MKNVLITPTYAPDFERCKVLIESASRWVTSVEEHLIIVDRHDSKLFETLSTDRVRIICKEDILPTGVYQLPLQKRWWLTGCSWPVRGWILQQIIKLAVARESSADAAVFVDSDVLFIKPTDLNDLWVSSKLRLFRCERGPNQYRCKRHQNWYKFACSSLSIPEPSQQQGSFIAQLTAMRPDMVKMLCIELENKYSRPWYQTLLQTFDFSEFVLYGLFIEKIGEENAGHFFTDQQLCHSSWFYDIQDENRIQDFINKTLSHHHAIHLQSNLGLAPINL